MLEETLSRYFLAPKDMKTVDLTSCHMQQRPNRPFPSHIISDTLMKNSPHREIFQYLIDNGMDWLRSHYHETRYYAMNVFLGKEKFPNKISNICRSLRKGYLRDKYKNDYIVILEQPFAHTRYNRRISLEGPEIFIGHHRAGCLLALGCKDVPVMIAQDTKPGSHYSAGKIHDYCIDL